MVDYQCQECNKINHFEELYKPTQRYDGFVCYNCKTENQLMANMYGIHLNHETYSDIDYEAIIRVNRENVLPIVSYMVKHGKLSDSEMEKIKQVITNYQSSRDKYDM